MSSFNIIDLSKYSLAICFAVLCTFNGWGYYLTFLTLTVVLLTPIFYTTIKMQQLPKLRAEDFLVLFFIGWLSLSLLWSQDSDASLLGLSRLGLFGIGYVVTKIIISKNNNAHIVIFRLIVVFIVIFSCFPTLEQFVIGYNVRSGGLIYDPSVAGIIIVFASIFLILFCTQKKLNYLDLLIIQVALLICFLGLLFTDSRSAIISFIPAVCVLFFVSLKSSNFKQTIRLWIPPTLTATVAITIYICMHGTLFNRLLGIPAMVSSSDSNRYYLYKAAIDIFQQFSPMGSGLFTYPSLYQTVRQESYEFGYYAHNDYLQILAETGIAGLTFFTLILIYCLYTLFRLLIKNSRDTKKTSNFISLTSCLWLISLFIQSLFYFVFYVPATALLAGIAFASLSGKNKPIQSTNIHAVKFIIILPLAFYLFSLATDASFNHRKLNTIDTNSIDNINTVHKYELIGIRKNYPKLILGELYFQDAFNEPDKDKKILKLQYSMNRTCAYLKKTRIRKEPYQLLAKIYNYYEYISQGRVNYTCPKDLPKNKIEAIRSAIQIAPFDSYDLYKTLIYWLESEGRKEEAEITKNELANIVAVTFDSKNQKDKGVAQKNSAINRKIFDDLSKDQNINIKQNYKVELRELFFYKIFSNYDE